MNTNRSNESGIVILALFMLIIVGVVIAAFFFVTQQQRKAKGQDTQIKIESTINL